MEFWGQSTQPPNWLLHSAGRSRRHQFGSCVACPRSRPTPLNSLDKEGFLVKVRSMSRITSKLQVTLPKALADRLRIRPGDEVDWQDAGDTLRVLPRRSHSTRFSSEMRLRLFDEATRRQRRRQARKRLVKPPPKRGWTREELYGHGRPD